MSRGTHLRVVGRLAAGMAVAGALIVGLSFRVVFPDPLGFWLLGLAAVTVAAGVVLCRPYLRVAGRGYSLNSNAGDPGRWLTVLMAAGGLGMWLILVFGSGDWHGNPERTPSGGYAIEYKGHVTEVTRTDWLAARRHQTRVLAGTSTFFLSGVAWWCAAAARG